MFLDESEDVAMEANELETMKLNKPRPLKPNPNPHAFEWGKAS